MTEFAKCLIPNMKFTKLYFVHSDFGNLLLQNQKYIIFGLYMSPPSTFLPTINLIPVSILGNPLVRRQFYETFTFASMI